MDGTAASDDFVGQLALTFILLLAVYIVPSLIAFGRRHPNRWAILAVNLVFGGTGIGWLGTLIWALNAVHRPVDPARSPGGESGLNLFVNDTMTVRLASTPEAVAGPSLLPVSKLSTVQAIAELDRLSRLHAAGHVSEGELAILKHGVLSRMRLP